MGRLPRNRIAWQGLSILCYLVGLVLFLVVVGTVFLEPPAYSLENIRPIHLGSMLVGVGLIALGKAVGWQYGVEAEVMASSMANLRNPPQKTKLEELGYRVPSEATGDGGSKYTYEDGTVYVVCSECGARNESDFTYCNDCSAKLPE